MATLYRIRVRGHLEQDWLAWFDDFTVINEANGEAVLVGPIADQAALHGVLNKVRDLGLPLLAVCAVTEDASEAEPASRDESS